MTTPADRLLIDCSAVMKWKLASEPFAAEAHELLLDGEAEAVELCSPDQLRAEVVNAFLKAHRRNRLSLDEARDGLREVLTYPFTLYRTTARVVSRAFEIAVGHHQHAYDCIYVAMAEAKRIEFWTGDDRLYNALHATFPFIRRIADYTRKRP